MVFKKTGRWLGIGLLSIFSFGVHSGAQAIDGLSSSPLENSRNDDYHGPLFETIPPEVSGLTAVNEYNHPEAWGKYWLQYYNGSIGTGVSLGDVNGDGLPDIFLASKDTSNALYLNNGDFTFRDVTEAAGVGGKEGFGSGSSFADVDNDGDLDLYVCYIGSANELFINDGSGVFKEEGAAWGLDVETGSNAPSFADMDRDGDLDLYIQCNFLEGANKPEGMPDFLFENHGDRFEDITEKAGIEGRGQGHAAVWWDYNEDGWPDIYVANDFEPTDKLYLNNKDNTFTDVIKETFISAPYFGMGADIGDINNDGHLDFVVADMASDDHVKHHTSVGTQGRYLVDISKTKISQFIKNMVTVKIGPNQFMEVAHLAGLEATGWTWAARLVDMDNDGLLDAFFANGMIREFHNSDIATRMGYARSVRQRILQYERSPRLDERNMAFRNEGQFSFKQTSSEWGLDLNGISFAAAFADFDQDGDLDLVVNNLNTPPTLYRNQSQNGKRVTLSLVGAKSNRFGVGAKVTAVVGESVQARELSLTRGYMSQDEPLIHFSFPEAETIDSLKVEWPSGVVQTFANVSTGSRYRIQESEQQVDQADVKSPIKTVFTKSKISVPEETHSEEDFYDLFAKQLLVPFDETWSGPKIALEDLDADGWLDLVMGGATGQETRVFKNDGGTLELVESDVFFDDYDSEDTDIVIFDYDGDDDLDLMLTAGSIELDAESDFYRDRIYLQDYDLEFERLDDYEFETPPMASRGAAAIDVNGDGLLDLLIGGGTVKDQYPFTGDNQVWIRDEDRGFYHDRTGSFAEAFAKSGKATELHVFDIDGDGDRDVVQGVEWGVPILWIYSEGEMQRVSDAFQRLKGIWRSVASGDFDSDGRIDLVMGNIGSNSKYRATPEKPVALFTQIKDCYGNHLEALTLDDGRLHLMEIRNFVTKQFSDEVLAATKTYEEYAKMPIEDMFPNLVSDFDRRDLNECRSMVFLQKEPGKFTPVALPTLAQTGVANDMLVGDFNGDGVDDIVIAHEPLPSVVWAKRRLKGHLVLLLGDGQGGFEALLPWRSGLEINGYPKHLAYGDLDKDGRNELLVSQNDGPLVIFTQNER